jgi:hypothetical protein
VVNKLDQVRSFEFKLPESEGKITVLGDAGFVVPANGQYEGAIFVVLPPKEILGLSFDVKIDMVEQDKVVRTLKTRFSGPML